MVVDYNQPIICGKVRVNPMDLIFADYDGVIVIPAEVVPDAIALATEKVTRENHTRDELMREWSRLRNEHTHDRDPSNNYAA